MKASKVIMTAICIILVHTTMVFSIQQSPGTADQVSPVDTIGESRPTFKWYEGENTAWYQLFIRNRSTGKKIVQWYEIEDQFSKYPQVSCVGGECTAKQDSDLPDGTYDWWVLSWNDAGSRWAGPMKFTVQTGGSLPSKAILISPSGTADSSPFLAWEKDAHATWYNVYLAGAENSFKYVQWYEIGNNDSRYPEADCSGNQCEVALDASLAPGVYTWLVKSWNSNGGAAWSDAMTFTVASDSSNLVKFESSQELSEYLKENMKTATRDYQYYWMTGDLEFAMVDASDKGAAAGSVYSGTNVQVSGVDELDTIKFDGQYLFVAPANIGYSSPEKSDAIKIFELSSAQPVEKARISIEDHEVNVDGFYLVPGEGETVPAMLITIGGKTSQIWSHWCEPWYWTSGKTEIVMYDVADSLSPVKKTALVLDGNLISSRRINDKLYIVTKFTPTAPGPEPYVDVESPDEFVENETPPEDISLDVMLPRMSVDGVEKGNVVTAENCFYPGDGPAGVLSSMVTITMIDISDPENLVSQSIVGPTEALFVSTQALYLATSKYEYLRDSAPQSQVSTQVHKFKLEEGGPIYKASASVEGHLGWEEDKKSFRMGEYDGIFRIATSKGNAWDGTESTTLTLLKEEMEGDAVSLTQTGSIEGIGKPGEKLYASRFIGNKAYLVTFKVTDPFYVFDLSDPYNPVTLGELKIDGYSDYLHPISENLLLGIGKDAVPDDSSDDFGGRGAWYQGVKLSLFDVSDPRNPTEVSSLIYGKRGTQSDLLTDHHALAYLPPTDLEPARIAVPMELHDIPPENNYYYSEDDPRTYYGWTHTGLYWFEIETGDRPDVPAGIKKIGDIIAESADSSSSSSRYYSSDRALLVYDRVHYIHDAKVWSSDWNMKDTD